MSDPEKPKAEPRPESPTTAKALDFDDDTADTPASPPRAPTSNLAPAPALGEVAAPLKPPRPLAPEQQAENTLKEAFPSIDAAVVKAVLLASGGKLEPAFNALLGMSDPDAAEPAPPPRPARRQQSPLPPRTAEEDQLAADERYARQLAEHYNGVDAYSAAPVPGGAPRQQYRGPPRQPIRPVVSQNDEERERSFLDDDLPAIRENIKKGFLETQSTVNKWVNTLKKKIDGEDDDDDDDDDFRRTPAAPAQDYVPRRSSEFGRRSADRERYDADPQVLGDDFVGLQMHDSETHPQRRSSRPQANPDLFKPMPARPLSNSGRRVSFQEGPPEEIDIHYPTSPSPINRPSSGASGKNSKWQPLAAVDPSPVTDRDPFSLGDSDDEDAKKKDSNPNDSERLKKAAAEAMADDIGGAERKKLEPAERSGSIGQNDKDTEDLMKKS